MALRATVYKAELLVSDLDRQYYASHSLTLAKHPSETEERLMARLLAFALFADEGLSFGRGLSSEDEADLWQIDLTGAITRWIDVGLPDERALRKACARATQVVVLAYGGRGAELWWQQNRAALTKLPKLTILALPFAASQGLAALADRGMNLQCTIQDGQLWFSSGEETLHLVPEVWLEPAA